ncbi:type III pantothenate kinase [bacterium]|nr:type III pantothenate kinase [bacterium]
MLIAMDVGNTHICLGVFDQQILIKEFRVSTNRYATADETGLILSGLVKGISPEPQWEGVIIASVVPELDSVMIQAAQHAFGAPVEVVQSTTPLSVTNKYNPPEVVGADRLVNAVAAVQLFGAPVIIVDFGTAITVDVVSEKKEYLGGAILPGLTLSADALARGTSLLHRVELKSGAHALGRNTEESLRSGIILGAAGAVSLLITQMKKEIRPAVKVVATGGLAFLVAPYCEAIQAVRPELTLEGLRIAWDTIKSRG